MSASEQIQHAHDYMSLRENALCIIGPLRVDYLGYRGLHLTKAGNDELWCFHCYQAKQTVDQTVF